MAKKTAPAALASWTAAVGATAEEIKAAWEDLLRRRLVTVRSGKRIVSPLALRRASSDVQRRLLDRLQERLASECPGGPVP